MSPRMDRILVIAGLLLTAGLTGCIGTADEPVTSTQGPDAPPEDPGTEPELPDEQQAETGPIVDTHVLNGSVQGVDSVALGHFCVASCDEHSIEFDVDDTATGVVAEVTWEDGGSLALNVDPPRDHCETGPAGILYTSCPRESTDGQSPLRLEVTDPGTLEMTGTWDASVWAKQSPDSPVSFTLYVSVFHGEPVPDGFTHLDG